jgi:ubiquinone/menaquinone biosynthesis C-methylase UbiE
MVVVTSNQRDIILGAVQRMYTDVALRPRTEFHFPTGASACRLFGYPPSQIERIPEAAIESFAGVGYPFATGMVGPGDVVLDIGSGSGTDALISSVLVGAAGEVIGIDMTRAMLDKFQANVQRMNVSNVRALRGEAEELPLPDESIDVVTSNGVLNLVPDKTRAVQEIFRVLRPQGRVQIADIVLGTAASEACRSQPQLWAECIVGATTEAEYLGAFESAGFTDIVVLSRFDYFAHSASEETRKIARSLSGLSMVMRARKGT